MRGKFDIHKAAPANCLLFTSLFTPDGGLIPRHSAMGKGDLEANFEGVAEVLNALPVSQEHIDRAADSINGRLNEAEAGYSDWRARAAGIDPSIFRD